MVRRCVPSRVGRLVYFSHVIDAKVALCDAIWRIVVWRLILLVLFLLLSFIRYGPCSYSTVDSLICDRGLLGVLLPLLSQVLGLVDNPAFM